MVMKSATESLPTLQHVLETLVEQGAVAAGSVPAIEEKLRQSSAPARSEPWFVKLLMAAGAWVAALFFVQFLGIAGLIQENAAGLFLWAVVFLVAAVSLRARSNRLFTVQLALALSVAGHGFALASAVSSVGLVSRDTELLGMAVTSVALCIGLYLIYRDPLHRFLSCLLASGCIVLWIANRNVWPALYFLLLFQVAAIGFVFVKRPDLRLLRPLGFATTIAITASMSLVLLPEEDFTVVWWPVRALFAGCLIWLYQWIVGGWNGMRNEPMMIVVAATLALASFTTPGILAALAIMILGYARWERELIAIGLAFFPMFIVVFYFEWQTSLLTKSWILAGSGAVLLAARYYLSCRAWAREEE